MWRVEGIEAASLGSDGSVESNKRTKKFLGINKCKGKIHEKKAAERPLKC